MSPTYPSTLVVPSTISDATLALAAKHRSKGRVPTLTYLHWANQASITRSSQPMVGLTQNRSVPDEKLVEAIFASHQNDASQDAYGATLTNLIVDARPTTNAMANHAKGAGSENMEYYTRCRKVYLGIDNIHVMRDSFQRIVSALRAAEEPWESQPGQGAVEVDSSLLARSQWLKHLGAILDGVRQVVQNVHVRASHVLVHCSDGWDRTAQLTSLAALCMDPYYRTFEGFSVLIEKDWVSFGHQFQERHGLLDVASSRFDLSAPHHDLLFDADAPDDEYLNDVQPASQAFWGFTKSLAAHFQGGGAAQRAPIFYQFLDCVWQLQYQFPSRFEFNGAWLAELVRLSHSGRCGTFLYNCERELRTSSLASAPPCDRTPSAWDHDWRTEPWRNHKYDPSLDARDSRGDQGVLFPDPKRVRFSSDLLRHTDKTLNAYVDAERAEQARLRQRLADASVDVPSRPVPMTSTTDESLAPEETLQVAARSVRSLFSDGWGRVQEAMRKSGADRGLAGERPSTPSFRAFDRLGSMPARAAGLEHQPRTPPPSLPAAANPWAQLTEEFSGAYDPPTSGSLRDTVPDRSSEEQASSQPAFDPLGVGPI